VVTDNHKMLPLASLCQDVGDRSTTGRKDAYDKLNKYIKYRTDVPESELDVVGAPRNGGKLPKRDWEARLWEHPAQLDFLKDTFIARCRSWAQPVLHNQHSFAILVERACSSPAAVKVAADFADAQVDAWQCLKVRSLLFFFLQCLLWPQWMSRVFREAKIAKVPWREKKTALQTWKTGCEFLSSWATMQAERLKEDLRSGERRLTIMLSMGKGASPGATVGAKAAETTETLSPATTKLVQWLLRTLDFFLKVCMIYETLCFEQKIF